MDPLDLSDDIVDRLVHVEHHTDFHDCLPTTVDQVWPVPGHRTGQGRWRLDVSKPDRSDRIRVMSVAIVMGSSSDASIMDDAVQTLRSFGVPVEVRVISAHRTPDDAIDFARTAVDRGVQVLIAAAGGAAHLAGVLAAATPIPVIGVPVALANLGGLDSLLAMVQMPKGVPVATVAVNGARNAALMAVRILALSDEKLAAEQDRFRRELADQVHTMDAEVQARYAD